MTKINKLPSVYKTICTADICMYRSIYITYIYKLYIIIIQHFYNLSIFFVVKNMNSFINTIFNKIDYY